MSFALLSFLLFLSKLKTIKVKSIVFQEKHVVFGELYLSNICKWDIAYTAIKIQ